MRLYSVRAACNDWQITYGYLVEDETATKAVEKLRRYVEENKVPVTVRKRAKVATRREIDYFKDHEKEIIR